MLQKKLTDENILNSLNSSLRMKNIEEFKEDLRIVIKEIGFNEIAERINYIEKHKIYYAIRKDSKPYFSVILEIIESLGYEIQIKKK